MTYILPIITVIIAFIIVKFVKFNNKSNFKLLLAFSGAFLIALTLFNLLPEVYHTHSHETSNLKTTGLFIMVGILLQIFLEFFSKGAEHGHVHLHKEDNTFPWMLFISLSIHAILEGFPLHAHHDMVWGIIIHKLPVAIILTTFFLGSKISMPKIMLFLALFSVMTPVGTLLAQYAHFLQPYQIKIEAIVIGILLHIATVILFESNEAHKFNLRKLAVIIVGVATAYFI